MKKSFSLLLLVTFILAAIGPVCGEAAQLFDFEDGKNPGFYQSGTCKYSVVETDAVSGTHALEISSRTGNDWDAVDLRPAKLGISAGDTVLISFWARQDSGKAGFISVSYAGGTYATLACAEVPSGIWTKIEGEFVHNENQNLRFKTDYELAGVSFYIDDVSASVTRPGKQDPATKYGRWPSDIPSLKEVYGSHFLFGGEAAGGEFGDKARMNFYASQYAIMTPGNELKPDSVFDRTASRRLLLETSDETSVCVRLNAAKPFLDFCRDNSIPVHGHTLLWHNQTPSEFFHLGYDIGKPFADRDIMLGRMENYIRAVMEITEEQYPGLIMSWDVVNEAVSDSAPELRKNVNWYKTVGPDYVEKAFEYARRYARPDVLLCYNDYSTPYYPKLNGILNLLETLVAQGNIDCYGFQAHYESGQPGVSAVENAIRKIIALGLRLRVSEMDIKINTDGPASLQAQAKMYKELMDLFVRYDRFFIAVQTWGGTDDVSWLNGKYPLPFGPYGRPKPAFWAMVGQEEP